MNIEDPRIQQYIDNELSDSERISFEKELNSFPEIKEYIKFKRFIIEGIRSEGDEELKEYIRSRVQDESSENQTNLWLYAVASVTLVLVSYFFIVQYFKTGSIKEASKVLVLNEPIFSKQPKVPYKSELPMADSKSYSLDSAVVLNDNTAPSDDADVEMGDIPSSAGNEIPQKPELASPYSVIDEGDIYIHRSNLVPIRIASVESKMGRADNASTKEMEMRVPSEKMAVSKKKTSPISANNVNADTLRVTDTELSSKSNYKKIAEKVLLIFVQNNSGNSAIEVTNQNDNMLLLKISNLDNDNPLIYVINDKLYLELGPKSIFSIPQNNIKLINPKPITDKAILKAIQD